MFDILFGWRKASKCKKMIRCVQCRLKLLKNKRCSIVRQLRDDVAQLLKHGHDLSAFYRVEQLFKDESIVAVYDLLHHFCEFILIHLPYIRKHKDCPNDVNEAVSTLIFASARCGDLPELLVIRKLFGERYGKRFASVALELLPGNLVNPQIKQNLSIKSVPDDVKYRLVDEIARSCLQPGPLALEYYSELQQEQNDKNKGDQVVRSEVGTNCNRNEEPQVQGFNIMEAEGKIVHMNFSSDTKKLLIEPCHSHQGPDSNDTSTRSSTVLQSSPNSVEWSMHRKEEGRVGSGTQVNSPYEFRIPRRSTTRTLSASGIHNARSGHKELSIAAESSSESSSQLPKEMIYLDDIEEFKSPSSKDENCQDRRLFMFKSSVIVTKTEKPEDGFNGSYIGITRSSKRSRKLSGKRQRRKSFSLEGTSVKDVESTIYYGQSFDNSRNDNRKSHHRRKHQKKILLGQPDRMRSFCSGLVHECSLKDPCYFCTSDDKDDWESQEMRMTSLEGFPVRDLKEEKVEHSICRHHCRCFYTRDPNTQEVGRRDYRMRVMMGDNLGKGKGLDYPQSCASSLCSSSRETSPWTRKESHQPYLRAVTMPPERPSECRADNFLRSNSFPFQQPSHLGNGSSSCRHVHPNLPDYDHLAAKFMALKKANLQCRNSQLLQQA